MDTEFEANMGSTEGTFGAQDDDTRILLKWGAIVAAVVVITCFATTALLKVIGLISASWIWVMAAAGISSVVTGMVVLMFVVLFAAAFISTIRSIG